MVLIGIDPYPYEFIQKHGMHQHRPFELVKMLNILEMNEKTANHHPSDTAAAGKEWLKTCRAVSQLRMCHDIENQKRFPPVWAQSFPRLLSWHAENGTHVN